MTCDRSHCLWLVVGLSVLIDIAPIVYLRPGLGDEGQRLLVYLRQVKDLRDVQDLEGQQKHGTVRVRAGACIYKTSKQSGKTKYWPYV